MPQNNNQNGTKQNGSKPQEVWEGITKITVGGYKAIAQEQSIEIRPLTILAGANSSGKSSIMQPLLLMKQTLEAPFDPGALWLDGPILKFTSREQILSVLPSNPVGNGFLLGVEIEANRTMTTAFVKDPVKAFDIGSMYLNERGRNFRFLPDMSHDQIIHELLQSSGSLFDNKIELSVVRDRCFLEFGMKIKDGRERGTYPLSLLSDIVEILRMFGLSQPSLSDLVFTSDIKKHILETIYLPGLRGNPSRTYFVAAVGSTFPGTFNDYVASAIAAWRQENQVIKINSLRSSLVNLGLTNAVTAEPINDAQVELRVGRTLHGDASDMVSIADVGISVSQTLPVLVALLSAKPGQLVYLEQPEIHLHPRAQTAMAQVLVDAAMRGVRIVAETHSSLLLLGVQTLVAEGKLPPELVKLHWFERNDDGATTIRSSDLDEGGRFGDWPEDFDDVSLEAQGRYLDAAEQRMMVS